VQIGGDINVEGEEAESTYGFNSIAGDVVVEYKLNRAGNYILQGFSKNEYEDIIYGEITKTGVSFIFNKEFFYLKNLFSRTEREN
jgi:translocation and assembly module TamB